MSQFHRLRSFVRRASVRKGLTALLALPLIAAAAAGCAAEHQAPAAAEIERLLAGAEAGRIKAGDRVRVTGVVIDDDVERQLAFIGDDSRSIAVHTGRGGLATPRGRQVTVEARVEVGDTGPHLAEPLVISSTDGAVPDAISVDAGEVFERSFAGRWVGLASRVQAASMKEGRLHLTISSHGVQFDAEVRKPDRGDWRSLVGADVRLRGVVVPADPRFGIPAPGRVVVPSLADVELVAAVSTADQMLKVLTNAAEVQALSTEDAAMAHPVSLTARVTLNDPAWTVLFVQDDTAGIFVFTRSLVHVMPDCRPGDLVEIVGETGPGEFAPIIAAHRLTVKGHGPLPRARTVGIDRLLSGSEDSQLVEITGIVRSMATDAENHLVLDLAYARERIPAFVPAIAGQQPPEGLGMDAVVRVRAVAGARFNARRQMIGVQLWIPTTREIIVESPAPRDPFEVPVRTAGGLLNFAGSSRAGRMARIRGVVVLSREHVVYVRDDTATLEVRTAAAHAVRPGDFVEAIGFPNASDYSPLLEDAVLRGIGRAELPAAVRSHASDLLRGTMPPELVRIEARLLERIATPTEDVLLLDSGGTTLSAHLDRTAPTERVRDYQNGSLLELTGIPSVQAVRQAHRLVPRGLRLLLSSADAIELVESPPGLFARYSAWVLGAAIAPALLALLFGVRRRRARNSSNGFGIGGEATPSSDRDDIAGLASAAGPPPNRPQANHR